MPVGLARRGQPRQESLVALGSFVAALCQPQDVVDIDRIAVGVPAAAPGVVPGQVVQLQVEAVGRIDHATQTLHRLIELFLQRVELGVQRLHLLVQYRENLVRGVGEHHMSHLRQEVLGEEPRQHGRCSDRAEDAGLADEAEQLSDALRGSPTTREIGDDRPGLVQRPGRPLDP